MTLAGTRVREKRIIRRAVRFENGSKKKKTPTFSFHGPNDVPTTRFSYNRQSTQPPRVRFWTSTVYSLSTLFSKKKNYLRKSRFTDKRTKCRRYHTVLLLFTRRIVYSHAQYYNVIYVYLSTTPYGIWYFHAWDIFHYVLSGMTLLFVAILKCVRAVRVLIGNTEIFLRKEKSAIRIVE